MIIMYLIIILNFYFQKSRKLKSDLKENFTQKWRFSKNLQAIQDEVEFSFIWFWEM